jgi:dihydroorotate dehydrogenase
MKLSVTYLGKAFENPFVLASGPPTANAGMIHRAFEAGWIEHEFRSLFDQYQTLGKAT